MKKLAHKNIIEFKNSEILIDKKELTIFMELADNSLLVELTKPLSLAEIDKYFLDICEGLTFLH